MVGKGCADLFQNDLLSFEVGLRYEVDPTFGRDAQGGAESTADHVADRVRDGKHVRKRTLANLAGRTVEVKFVVWTPAAKRAEAAAAAAQTAAEPPNHGRICLAMIGWTRNSRKALEKIVSANRSMGARARRARRSACKGMAPPPATRQRAF